MFQPLVYSVVIFYIGYCNCLKILTKNMIRGPQYFDSPKGYEPVNLRVNNKIEEELNTEVPVEVNNDWNESEENIIDDNLLRPTTELMKQQRETLDEYFEESERNQFSGDNKIFNETYEDVNDQSITRSSNNITLITDMPKSNSMNHELVFNRTKLYPLVDKKLVDWNMLKRSVANDFWLVIRNAYNCLWPLDQTIYCMSNRVVPLFRSLMGYTQTYDRYQLYYQMIPRLLGINSTDLDYLILEEEGRGRRKRKRNRNDGHHHHYRALIPFLFGLVAFKFIIFPVITGLSFVTGKAFLVSLFSAALAGIATLIKPHHNSVEKRIEMSEHQAPHDSYYMR